MILVSSERELEKFVSREEAPELFDYLKMGGILRLKRDGKLVVLYPTKKQVEKRIRELEEKRKYLVRELAKLRHIKKRRRLIDPLKIKHRLLFLVDGEYRGLAESIDVEKLLEDERGRAIVEQLQRDREYRERVKMALKESPVYKRTEFGGFVNAALSTEDRLLGGQVKRLEQALQETEKELLTLRQLLRWLR